MQLITYITVTAGTIGRPPSHSSGLPLSSAVKMPFDEQGFYYHDFDKLPIIPEENEEEAPFHEAKNGVQRAITSNSPPVSNTGDEHGLISLGDLQTIRPARDGGVASTCRGRWGAAEPTTENRSLPCAHNGIWARLRKPSKLSSPAPVANARDHESRRQRLRRRLLCSLKHRSSGATRHP